MSKIVKFFKVENVMSQLLARSGMRYVLTVELLTFLNKRNYF